MLGGLRKLLTLGAVSNFVVACAGQSNIYDIDHAELVRIATLPPLQRGLHVRVLQQRGEREHDPVSVRAEDLRMHAEGPRLGAVGALTLGGSRGRGDGASIHAIGEGSSSFGGAFASSVGDGVGEAIGEILVYALVAGIGAGAQWCADEAVRYRGDVLVHPAHPLHLRSSDGMELDVALGDLTPKDAARESEAELRDNEEPGLVRLGRLPLDRKGLAFKFDIGPALVSGQDKTIALARAQMQLGYFPKQTLGVLLTLSMGNSAPGAPRQSAVGVEAQWFPGRVRRLHAGFFAGAGATDQQSEIIPQLTAGAHLEFGLTTSFALTARVGGVAEHEAQRWKTLAFAGLGFALY